MLSGFRSPCTNLVGVSWAGGTYLSSPSGVQVLEGSKDLDGVEDNKMLVHLLACLLGPSSAGLREGGEGRSSRGGREG
eukprot:757649-Hanusia_phi.AAC.2